MSENLRPLRCFDVKLILADERSSMPKEDDSALAVFTAESAAAILARGGSGDWVLDPKKANNYKYLVCCRNLNWRNRQEQIGARAAFLVARMAGLRELADSANARGQRRYLIGIAQYSLTNIPDAWRGVRNPIYYGTLKEMGIDLRKLKFEPVPKGLPGSTELRENRRMTIADAKQALAEAFGVSPEDVEITIRG